MRHRMPEEEIQSIISFCHDLTCRGHFGLRNTTKTILQSSFYWPAFFSYGHCWICKTCAQCQQVGRFTQQVWCLCNQCLRLRYSTYGDTYSLHIHYQIHLETNIYLSSWITISNRLMRLLPNWWQQSSC